MRHRARRAGPRTRGAARRTSPSPVVLAVLGVVLDGARDAVAQLHARLPPQGLADLAVVRVDVSHVDARALRRKWARGEGAPSADVEQDLGEAANGDRFRMAEVEGVPD